MSHISLKWKPGAGTATIVRYKYLPGLRKRSCTITLGSVPIDADPEDVRSMFKPGNSLRGKDSLQNTPLGDEDYTLIKAWLIKHGDASARARRAARDKRVEIALLDKFDVQSSQACDEFEAAANALLKAGATIVDLARVETDAARNPWQSLRQKYLQVYKAYCHFQSSAASAGVTKKIS